MAILNSVIRPFRALQWVALLALLAFLASNVIWGLAYRQVVGGQAQVIYVVGGDGATRATLLGDAHRSLPEAKTHVRRFMELLFTNEAATYTERLEAALHLIDNQEGRTLFANFERDKVYDTYLRHGGRSVFLPREVRINMDEEPFSGYLIGNQKTYFREQTKETQIAIRFSLVEVMRTEHNPNGLLIKDLIFVQPKTIK